MNTRSSGANLAQAMKELNFEWQQAREHWHDVKSNDFAEAYVEPLPGQVAKATHVIEELANLLQKVRTDCE